MIILRFKKLILFSGEQLLLFTQIKTRGRMVARDEDPDVQTEGRRIEDWLARDWGSEGPCRATVGGGGRASASTAVAATTPAPCLAVVSWSGTDNRPGLVSHLIKLAAALCHCCMRRLSISFRAGVINHFLVYCCLRLSCVFVYSY